MKRNTMKKKKKKGKNKKSGLEIEREYIEYESVSAIRISGRKETGLRDGQQSPRSAGNHPNSNEKKKKKKKKMKSYY